MEVLKRLFSLLRPYWKTLLLSSVLLLVRAGIELVPPLFQRAIIDDVIAVKDTTRLGILIGALVGVYAVQQGNSILDNYVRHALGERFILDLRVRLYAYLQRAASKTCNGYIPAKTGHYRRTLLQQANAAALLQAYPLQPRLYLPQNWP